MNTSIDTANLCKYIDECKDELKNLLIDLCKIPAPPHLEQGRASFCEKWFKEHCTKNVHTDSALNVICEYGDENAREIIIFMAHMDTVFPDTEPMPMREENGRLMMPVAIRLNHASADGFLAALFYKTLEKEIAQLTAQK